MSVHDPCLADPAMNRPQGTHRRKLLIISYLFPPMGGIAVQRALSLTKYLPRDLFEVHVLRAKNASGPWHDPGLLRHVPADVRMHTAFSPEIPFHLRHKLWSLLGKRGQGKNGAKATETARPARPSLPARIAQRILCPEPEILWVPFAFRTARRIIEKERIDAVMVTAPPFSAFVAGVELKRTFPHVQFIADFRDEWLTFYLNNNEFQNTPHTRKRATEIERQTVTAADLVVAVTESSLAQIRERYPSEPDSKFQCISNGFDPAAFADFVPSSHGGRNMVVTHVGTGYKNASPRYYLDALDGLPEDVRQHVDTRFIGRFTDTERALLEGRKSPVHVLGFMQQADAVRHMQETDYLLLTMTDTISMPGKYYEYLATGKPILAISPAGSEVDRMIRQTGGGWCADPGDVEAIRRMLLTAYDTVRTGGRRPAPDAETIRRYQRPHLAEQYGRLMHSLCGDAR